MLDVDFSPLTFIEVFLMTSTPTSLYLGFHQGVLAAFRSHHNFPWAHNPASLPSLPQQQVPPRWLQQMQNYSHSHLSPALPNNRAACWEKADEEPLSITAWDTDSYLPGRIKTRPQNPQKFWCCIYQSKLTSASTWAYYILSRGGWLDKIGQKWQQTTGQNTTIWCGIGWDLRQLVSGQHTDPYTALSGWWQHKAGLARQPWERDKLPPGQWETRGWGSEPETGDIE